MIKRSCYEILLCGLYEIKIYRKHPVGANITFHLEFLSPKKITYVSRMLLLYFKTEKASFMEQRFFLEVISVKFMDWSKAQIVNTISAESQNEKNENTLLSGTFKVSENISALTFIIFGL